MDYYPGGYAEYCLAWADMLHPMAPHVSMEEEAMRDILGVAVHAVGRSGLSAGAAVLCIGGGPAGLCLGQVARERGAEHVVVSDTSPLAREVVSRHPGLTPVDPLFQDPQEALRGLSGRARFDAVFDSVGDRTTFSQALQLLAPAGCYVDLAVQDVQVPLPLESLGSERTLTSSSNAFYRDEREAHQLIASGDVDVRTMITHRFPISGYEEAFALLAKEPREAYKVVFVS
jgi:threonine dehydrogenase-like Zn-dependent dehydrogenase